MAQTVEVQGLEELLARYSGGKFDAAVDWLELASPVDQGLP